jgi:hypothetical protein
MAESDGDDVLVDVLNLAETPVEICNGRRLDRAGRGAAEQAWPILFGSRKKGPVQCLGSRVAAGAKILRATPEQRNNVKILVGLTLCLAWRERHSSD